MKFTIIIFFSICFMLNMSCSRKNKTDLTDTSNTESVQSGKVIPYDVYPTNNDSLRVTVVGHGSLMFEYKGKIIHVDPYSEVTDYSKLPKADLILITHEHHDHLDTVAINAVKKADTHFIMSKICSETLKYGDVINNGDSTSFNGVSIKAVPAYNLVHQDCEAILFHPKGRGNGYLLLFDGLKVYVGGDTENIPEMKTLKGTIDIAFLPKNLPYTMDDDMFINAAEMIKPKNLYPYHMTEFDEAKISHAINDKNIKILVRPMSNH